MIVELEMNESQPCSQAFPLFDCLQCSKQKVEGLVYGFNVYLGRERGWREVMEGGRGGWRWRGGGGLISWELISRELISH